MDKLTTERVLTKSEVLKRGIYKKDGELWISSLQVAGEFRKGHNNLLDKLHKLMLISELDKFNLSNFKQVKYIAGNNEIQPMYEMTEAGYYSLITGFTGKKADIARAKLAHDFTKLKEFVKTVIAPTNGIEKAITILTRLQADGQNMMAHQTNRLDKHEVKICEHDTDIKVLKAKVVNFEDLKRMDLKPSDKKKHLVILHRYYRDACPMCACAIHNKQIEFDHWYGKNRRGIDETWPLCKECHAKITHKRDVVRAVIPDIHFKRYQIFVQKYLQGDQKPLPF